MALLLVLPQLLIDDDGCNGWDVSYDDHAFVWGELELAVWITRVMIVMVLQSVGWGPLIVGWGLAGPSALRQAESTLEHTVSTLLIVRY